MKAETLYPKILILHGANDPYVPASGSDNSKGAAYIKISAERGWDQMKAFFKTTL